MADPSHQKPQNNHPEGMEPYDLGGEGDLGALSKEQQEKLNRFKVNDQQIQINVYIFTSILSFVFFACTSTSFYIK